MCEHEKIAGGTWVGWESHMIIVRQLAAAKAELAELNIDKTILLEILARQRMIISGNICGECPEEQRGKWLELCKNCEVMKLRNYEEKYFTQYCDEASDKRDLLFANERAEQAEAQAAAMRIRFEKYVRENCKLIRHSVADGLDKPGDVEGKCGGYCQNFDEPHHICQECVAAYDPDAEYNEEFVAAGFALLTENRRMREALERLVDESERRLWIEKEEGRDLPHLARAIDLAQQAMKGTDNEKD